MTAALARLARSWAPAVVGVLLLPGSGLGAEPVAVLTELRVSTGEIRVRRAQETDWRMPEPLLALRPGDQVRCTGDGRAVLVFTGGGVQTVSAANSPFAVEAPRGQSGTERARAVLGGAAQFLLGQQKTFRYESLSVRGVGPEPTRLVSPRATSLLPGPVTFEWTGPAALRYHVQVLGSQGVQWQQSDLPRRPVTYPASAPPLQPGTRYTWALSAPGQPVQQAQFQILPTAEATRVQAILAELRTASESAYPPNTVLLMRAGLLVQEGLYAAARRELVDGLAANPDSPEFHVLLGTVYERTGLDDLAAQEADEAGSLWKARP